MPDDIIALIPARGGSKRIPRKNVRPLCGVPLVEWTMAAASQSGIFSGIYVSTDDPMIAELVRPDVTDVRVIGAPCHQDESTDIEWVSDMLAWLEAAKGITPAAFSILRPTSPFRTAGTIQRAWESFVDAQPCDSLRAVERAGQHPGKMWVMQNGCLFPLLPFSADGVPWHSRPTQSLPDIYVQNASLEMAWSRVVKHEYSISGQSIVPFLTHGTEGFDINTESDWAEAERIASTAGMITV